MIRINDSDIAALCDRLDSCANSAQLSDAERLDLRLATAILQVRMQSGARSTLALRLSFEANWVVVLAVAISPPHNSRPASITRYRSGRHQQPRPTPTCHQDHQSAQSLGSSSCASTS
jgi:hypothetical protein